MATIITRLYKDEAAANAVVSDLKAGRDISVTSTIISGSGDVKQKMLDLGLSEEAADAYGPKVESGNALLTVTALLGQAQGAKRIVNSHPAEDAGVANENVYVPTKAYKKDTSQLIMKDHPLMLTSKDQVKTSGPFAMRYGDFFYPLLSKRKPVGMTVYSGTKRFGAFLMPLLSNRKPLGMTVYNGTKRFGAFLVPLLSGRKPPAHAVYKGTVHFGDFLVPLISKR